MLESGDMERAKECSAKIKDTKTIVYCATGNRSVSSSRILEENGFTPLNVKGGIIELKNADAILIR